MNLVKKKAEIVFRHSLKWYTLCRCRLFENVWFEHILLYMYKYVQTWLENNFLPLFSRSLPYITIYNCNCLYNSLVLKVHQIAYLSKWLSY